MPDLLVVLQWWIPIFIVGIVFLPTTDFFFSGFLDRGYLFSKVLGLGITTYIIFVLSFIRILPFNILSIILVLWVCLMGNFYFFKKTKYKIKSLPIKAFILEEILFLICIIFWSYIRAHEPSINGLEKFMDFGFLNSILRSTYMPPNDMWFTPFSINYYYFGHLTTAVLTKISFLPSLLTFNLMIATLFAFTFSLSFSLVMNLVNGFAKKGKALIGGLLAAFFVSFGGNLHTIYSLFKPYDVDNPVPFWKLAFLPQTFPNSYWYPNATRFIPFTIHEFPIYSFVVSDLHGHVLDLMYVLLLIALSYVLFVKGVNKIILGTIALFLAIMYMTNAWDGAIYMLLVGFAILARNYIDIKSHIKKNKTFFSCLIPAIKKTIVPFLSTAILFVIFTLPFSLTFKPFASGIGVLCAPSFLTKMEHLGPFLFEANHCQKSSWWELLTLYGAFYFFALSLVFFVFRTKKKILDTDYFALILIGLSTILIIIPEFIYLKDIYPAHYRANTMFKLVYQSFIMLSLVSSYAIVRIITSTKNILFYLASVLILIGIFIYPYFAIKGYYGDLTNYKGLDGTSYLKERYPHDYAAINWINKNIKGTPVIAEAQGDSYTDYGRISSNTGLPTILGWTVHEWLWRGTYDVPAPRIEEVRRIYESNSLSETKQLLNKYKTQYVYIGDLEREKYPSINETKFNNLGKVVFQDGNSRLYKLNN
ncbi:MAG TPA: DUF2298 domain-containing protein [Patescibacteria group bacterium]|nr:DUF2298 domain-containing protein [Patescibacteria group bacterium]